MIFAPEYLLQHLHVARTHRVTFDRAWPDAVAAAVAVADEPEAWEAVFQETRDGWRRAFAGAPMTRGERALVAVGAELEVEEDRAARRCAYCNAWVPVDRDGRADYCSDRCRRRANYELERERVGRPAPPRRRVGGGPDPAFDGGRRLTLTLADWIGRTGVGSVPSWRQEPLHRPIGGRDAT